MLFDLIIVAGQITGLALLQKFAKINAFSLTSPGRSNPLYVGDDTQHLIEPTRLRHLHRKGHARRTAAVV